MAIEEAAPEAAARGHLRGAGKADALAILGEMPLVAETPASLLDHETTSIEAFFVRNSGAIPEPVADPATWVFEIDGEVERPLRLTLEDLHAIGETITRWLVLECGGNGRAAFEPQVSGNQWTTGGVGCAAWTGIALRDVLHEAGLKSTATYTAHHGADDAISRGIRLEKALDPETMLAWAMNGEPLPHLHGGPLRLVVPGWPGSASQKWLTGITIRDREHDGKGMTGLSYRVPIRPVAPGETPEPGNLRILESMPVRSVVTSPTDGARLPAGTRVLTARGAAWAGDLEVERVEVSMDDGATWIAASLAAPRNRHDWRRWSAQLPLATGFQGAVEILARATDSDGNVQPRTAEGWNPGGYGANAMHRVTVHVG